jgi:hypothetical protein
MSIESLAVAIHDTAFSGMIRGEIAGTEWIFPIVETLHVLCLVTVFGSIALVDVRLIGVSARNVPFSKLYRELVPWTWWAFLGSAIFGTALASGKIEDYVRSPQFITKFVLMGLAGVNLLIFHFGALRKVADWDSTLPVPMAARLAGLLSLCLWVGVIFTGRWVGFVT